MQQVYKCDQVQFRVSGTNVAFAIRWNIAYIVKQSRHGKQEWNILQPTSTETGN